MFQQTKTRSKSATKQEFDRAASVNAWNYHTNL